jgi:hypothetical protein
VIHYLGIRHHGPGSARSVKQFLEKLQPDIVLMEGPPDADGILQWVTHSELKPPVAILCYQPDNPDQSSFYPFATFSPEWQAIEYARRKNIHVRFMDLPSAHQFAIANEKIKAENSGGDENSIPPPVANAYLKSDEMSPAIRIKRDPVSYLAEAAGFDDGEKWWEHMFEHRLNDEAVFDAVSEMMTVLREFYPGEDDRLEKLREAYMRKTIRQAEKEMFQEIAVICGAWHVPALKAEIKAKEDNELLKGLPKVKVDCTWIPWTYNRLSFSSGYGAGIHSPGWYEHIWKYPNDNGIQWMAQVAKLFREKNMDTSVAHVIEAVRLAESLSSLRQLNKAGLEELNEATLSILCFGEDIMMKLVHDELVVSDRIGQVPVEIPKPPLQLDIEKLQKKLRLPQTADWKDYVFDLRKDIDLERSIFLHRLQLLEIKWGSPSAIAGKGTFKEQWRLQWDPGFSIDIIEKGSWGNTVEEAAEKYVNHVAVQSATLPAICGLLEKTIPAELPDSVSFLINEINNLAATSSDVIQLMEVIPGLVNTSRYGNVRKTDAEMVSGIVESLITRVCVSLPPACSGIDEDSSQLLIDLFVKMNDAVNTIQLTEITAQWQQALSLIAHSKNTSPLIAGYSTRLLTDYKVLHGEELLKLFYYAMSAASSPDVAASWLEGFLKGSGTLLLIDDDLWNVVNNWVDHLSEDVFIQVLPLLRRTFSEFSKPERRKLGEKVRSGNSGSTTSKIESGVNIERAKKGIDVVMKMFGYAGSQSEI